MSKPTIYYESITVSNTAVGFGTAKIKRPKIGLFPPREAICQEVFCVLETDSIRFTLDGVTVPTDTVGLPLLPGENLTLSNEVDIKNFSCIRVTSDASLKCMFKF